MDDRVARLRTPDDCEQFAINVQGRLPELARDVRRRAVELRAAAYGATTVAEREALQAVYAYERILFKKHGKNIRASYLWRSIKEHGIVGAVERAVGRSRAPAGYTALAEMGLEDMTFEAVVVRHPDVFTNDAVSRSAKRLQELEDIKDLQIAKAAEADEPTVPLCDVKKELGL